MPWCAYARHWLEKHTDVAAKIDIDWTPLRVIVSDMRPWVAESVPDRTEVVIVGAGLSGLAAARSLQAAGRKVVVLESSDGVGGRVRSDLVEGFRLDRGFQVLLTAYPELARQLDLGALDLCRFDPGALIWTGGHFHRVGDPRRMPRNLLSSAMAPIGNLSDKFRLARWQHQLRRADPVQLLRGEDISSLQELREVGFSTTMIDTFFRPLIGGIQLDADLTASRRMLDLILRCLTIGDSAVPAQSMQAIPDQMAGRLPPGTVALGVAAVDVQPGQVTTSTGHVIASDRVVVATEGPTAARLLGIPPVASRSASCVWFAADRPPVTDKLIVLNGSGAGPALNVAVMTNVAPGYGPQEPNGSDGRPALVAAACPGVASTDLESAVRSQLHGWWGDQVDGWRHLRTDAIEHGQPDQRPPFHPKQSVSLGDGLFVCGDHRDTPSIQGALFSGRRCGEAVATSLT